MMELKGLREERKEMEEFRDELIKRAKNLQVKAQSKRAAGTVKHSFIIHLTCSKTFLTFLVRKLDCFLYFLSQEELIFEVSRNSEPIIVDFIIIR